MKFHCELLESEVFEVAGSKKEKGRLASIIGSVDTLRDSFL